MHSLEKKVIQKDKHALQTNFMDKEEKKKKKKKKKRKQCKKHLLLHEI